MILTTHMLVGAAIGAEVRNPFAVAGLAIAAHFVLDTFPHGDYLDKKSGLKQFWKVGLDMLIGFSFVAFFILSRKITDPALLRNIAIGIFFSLLPDGTTFLYCKMNVRCLKPIYDFHQKLHRAPDFSPERQFRLKNNLWDIFVSLASLASLFFFLH